MKKQVSFFTISSILTSLFTIFTSPVFAQKQPSIQTGNQRLPASAKIDARLEEWNNLLQASNKVTRVEYTIANDDSVLYLAVKSADKIVNSKIMGGGITLLINRFGKKSKEGGSSITFPVREGLYKEEIGPNGKPVMGVQGSQFVDSTGIVRIIGQLKKIGISGLVGSRQNQLPLANDLGVKVKIAYHHGLIYELSIPLKLLGLSLNDVTDFVYNIKLNAFPSSPVPPAAGTTTLKFRGPAGDAIQEIESSTDFWADYSLAKKP